MQDYNKLIVNKRYSVMKRDFNKKLEYYFTDKILSNNTDINEEDFQEFSPTKDLINTYVNLCQKLSETEISTNDSVMTMEEFDKKFDSLYEQHKKSFWESFQKSFLTIKQFKEIYPNKDRECEYCKIKESEIKDLIDKGKINTKKLLTRGRLMEIDQEDPNEGYKEGNMVLACYWCNNAKTDEFEKDEFKKVAEVFGEIWNKRKKAK